MRRALACAAVLAAAIAAATAGMQNWPCDKPVVFPGAAINVVILPYDIAPGVDSPGRDTGTELAALVQQEVLLAIAKFGSVGVVQLTGTAERGCTSELVQRKLLGDELGAANTIVPGRALVLVWGRVFESGGDLFLQSYIRFLRRGAEDRVRVPIGGETFEVRPSGQSFACLPRRIAVADLRRIGEIARARRVHERPDASSNGKPVPFGAPYPYWVNAVKGDWIEVRSDTGPSGWILAKAASGEWTLRERMPELAFVEGVSGYLRVLVARGGEMPATNEAALLDASERALRWYRENWRAAALAPDAASATAAQPRAAAIPLQIEGLLTLLRREPVVADLEAAEAKFAKAATLLPYSADAKNLDIVTRLLLSTRTAASDPKVALDTLEAALNVEPTNRVALENLKRLHRVLLAPADQRPATWAALADSERGALSAQLAALGAIRQ